MVMDDFGSLLLRVGKRLVVTHHDAEHTDGSAHQDGPAHGASPGKPAAAAE
jgi:hypothetical protein